MTKILLVGLIVVVLAAGVWGILFIGSSKSGNGTSSIPLLGKPLTSDPSTGLEKRITDLEVSVGVLIDQFKEDRDTDSTGSTPSLEAKVKVLETSVADLKSRVKDLETEAQTSSSVNSSPKEIILSFGSGGSTIAMTFTDISGTTIKFNSANYPGAKNFYFQANLKSDAPDRTTYVRIYDSKNSIGVQGSDINFTGLTSTFLESGALKFVSGDLTLNIQVRSLNGNLAIVENPRIRISY